MFSEFVVSSILYLHKQGESDTMRAIEIQYYVRTFAEGGEITALALAEHIF